jgi:hypothetical protein
LGELQKRCLAAPVLISNGDNVYRPARSGVDEAITKQDQMAKSRQAEELVGQTWNKIKTIEDQRRPASL